MNELVVKEYLGNGIEFSMIEGRVYANASSMCKPFGKLFSDWKRLKQTEEMILEISEAMGIPIGELVIVENGKSSKIHEELVLELAGWLDVKFRRWCQSQISTLIREGSVSLKHTNPLDMLLTMNKENLAMTCLQLTTIVKEKDEIIETKDRQLIEQEPMVSFADKLLKSKANILIGDFAKVLSGEGFSIGSGRLFDWLRANEYLYKDKKGNNLPYQTYVDRELFYVKENVIDSAFKTFITLTSLLTPKGQVYFYNKLKNEPQFNKK